MSVVKSKRKTSPFEVLSHLTKMRKAITDLLLRDLGYKPKQTQEQLRKKLQGRTYEELSDKDKEVYNNILDRDVAFNEWFIQDERQTIIDCLRKITEEVTIANSIYPVCKEELNERRIRQGRAIGQCYRLVQELQYAIETLPVDVNKYLQFGDMIQTEINLLKGWRKSDNRLKKAIENNNNNNNENNNQGNL